MSSNHPRLRKAQNALLLTALLVFAVLPFPWW